MATLPRGEVSAAAGRAAYEYIERAVRAGQAGEIHAIVTAPVNKEALAAAGVHALRPHRDPRRASSDTRDYAMLLMGKELQGHPRHHARGAAPRARPGDARARAARRSGWPSARWTGLGQPRGRIAVAGLNPHAGEDGLFGDEEKREIIPADRGRARRGHDVTGPLPADTLFSRARGGEFDIVVAMYHDQGHIPVKTLGFEYDEATKRWTGLSGVNVTVGLPFLRVSVDHGTAFDRAWKGIANHESMVEALDVAVRSRRR